MVPQKLRDFLGVRILRRHLRQELLKESKELGRHVAVVAVWPRFPLRMSVQRLLDALKHEGWSTVLVMNESPDLDRVADQWGKSSDVVIRRANIGRDFGAYQAGYRHLKRHPDYSKIEKLAFFNDSVLYPPNGHAIIAELLQKDVPLAGFFLNNQFHVHIQSFALMIGFDVVQSSEIASFWSSYYPSNIRRHAIYKGEVRMSQIVLRRWQQGEVVVTYERLLAADSSFWSNMSTPELLALRKNVEGGPRMSKDIFTKANSNSLYVDSLVREALSSGNVSHALGQVAARLLGCPLKLDLIVQGSCTPSDFHESLVKMSIDPTEISDLMRMMVARGTDASLGRFERQQIRFGFTA